MIKSTFTLCEFCESGFKHLQSIGYLVVTIPKLFNLFVLLVTYVTFFGCVPQERVEFLCLLTEAAIAQGFFSIWLFCLHGGDHPEGHRDIDFELDPEASIVASADGIVAFMEDNPHGWGTDIVIDHGKIAVDYTFLLNV
jgi:hypothetical protein